MPVGGSSLEEVDGAKEKLSADWLAGEGVDGVRESVTLWHLGPR